MALLFAGFPAGNRAGTRPDPGRIPGGRDCFSANTHANIPPFGEIGASLERGNVPPMKILLPPRVFSAPPRPVATISIRGPRFPAFIGSVDMHGYCWGAANPTQNAEIPNLLASGTEGEAKRLKKTMLRSELAQDTYIHTYRQTDRQTYRQTDRHRLASHPVNVQKPG